MSGAAERTRESPFALGEGDLERLGARLQLAVKRARRSGQPTLAVLTLPLLADSGMLAETGMLAKGERLPASAERVSPESVGVDPSAVACASRRPGEPWFLFEQPDRGARALAALGEVALLTATGPNALPPWPTAGAPWRPPPSATPLRTRAAAGPSPSAASPSPPRAARTPLGRASSRPP